MKARLRTRIGLFLYHFSSSWIIKLSRILSAFILTSSGSIPPTGCGTITRRRFGIHMPLAVACARTSKRLVQTVTVGLPLFSRTIAAWIHHVVQAPQSPTATITVSVASANCCISAASSAPIWRPPTCLQIVPASL